MKLEYSELNDEQREQVYARFVGSTLPGNYVYEVTEDGQVLSRRPKPVVQCPECGERGHGAAYCDNDG